MLLKLRAFGVLRLFVGVRVGEVYEDTREVGGRPVHIWGWSYRTLEGHVESGQMDWEVWKLPDTGSSSSRPRHVAYRAHSQPARCGSATAYSDTSAPCFFAARSGECRYSLTRRWTLRVARRRCRCSPRGSSARAAPVDLGDTPRIGRESGSASATAAEQRHGRALGWPDAAAIPALPVPQPAANRRDDRRAMCATPLTGPTPRRRDSSSTQPYSCGLTRRSQRAQTGFGARSGLPEAP